MSNLLASFSEDDAFHLPDVYAEDRVHAIKRITRIPTSHEGVRVRFDDENRERHYYYGMCVAEVVDGVSGTDIDAAIRRIDQLVTT